MGTIRQDAKERSMAAILEAASAEFAANGYAGTRLRTVAARARVANGLINSYFGSKEELLCRIIKSYDLTRVYRGITEDDPFRIFCVYLDHIRSMQKADPDRFQLILRIVSESGFPASVWETVREGFKGSPIESAIGRAQEEGELPAGEAFDLFRILSGSVYVLLNQYAVLGITAPENASILQVLGYNPGKKAYEEALRKASELENFKKRLNDEMISRMSDTDGLFLIDCVRDSRHTIHDIRALRENFRDDEAYTSAIGRYISTLVVEEDREMMHRVTSPSYMLERAGQEQEFTVVYRSISTGVPRFYEMRVARFSDTEVLQSFRENDRGIFRRYVYTGLEDDFFALYGVDLDAGIARILKASPWYGDGAVGESLRYTEALERIAAASDGEAAEFFERIGDTDHLRQRLEREEKLSYTYKSPSIEDGRWVSATIRVLSRHTDGVPYLLALGFTLLDAGASEKEELRIRLNEAYAREAESNQIIGALARDYGSVSYIGMDGDPGTDTVVGYGTSDLLRRVIPGWEAEQSFSGKMDLLRNTVVYPPDKTQFSRETQLKHVKSLLTEADSCSVYTRFLIDGAVQFYEMKFAAIREAGRLTGIVTGFHSIDRQRRAEIETQRQLEEALTFTHFFLDRYVSAYYVGLDDMVCQVYQRTDLLEKKYPIITNYLDSLDEYIARDVHPDDRAKLRELTRPENLRRILAEQPEVTCVLRDISGGAERIYRFQAIRGADEAHAAFGFIDITEELGEQERRNREADESRRLIESVSDAYDVAYTVNMMDSSVKLLKIDRSVPGREKLGLHKSFEEIREAVRGYVTGACSERLLREMDYARIRERLSAVRAYNVEYTSLIAGETSWYEMNITGIGEDEFAIGFARRDTEITKRRLEEMRYDEYFALFSVDIDTGMLKVIKNEERYRTVPVGGTAPYSSYLTDLAQGLDGEPREFFLQLADPEYAKRELAKEDKRTYAYKSINLVGDKWIELTAYCILRHDDGSPAMFTIGFSIVDALATAREELRRQIGDALDRATVEAQRNDVITGIVNGARFTYEISAEDEVTAAHYAEVSAKRIGRKYLDKMDWLELLHPEDKERVTEAFYASVRDRTGNTPYNVTFRMLGTDGQYRWVRSGGNVIRRTDGSGEFFGISIDITQQMEEQEQQQAVLKETLELAESASRAKTEFLFNMSHDVRTPMNAILGFTDLAKKYIDDRGKALDCLEKARQSGNLLLSLINGVLDMSRIEHGDSEVEEKPGDVLLTFANIENTLREEAGAKEISLSFEIGEVQDRYVYADYVRCLRILTNLITNAIKYTGKGGTVKVRCDQVSSVKDGRALYRYIVEDNGIGMSPAFRERMYESFTRENNSTVSGIQGTGLGLAVCKTFVDFLGGTIECESEQGRGTRFTVILPFRVQEGREYVDPWSGAVVGEGVKAGSVQQIDLSGKRVLLVEDNEMNREIANELLSDEGVEVEEAYDGSSAVELLRREGPSRYDFILMDIQMPRMNGYEATRAIREMYPDTSLPIIALSANAFEEDRRMSAEAGMNDHVAKPIDIRELKEVMAKYL